MISDYYTAESRNSILRLSNLQTPAYALRMQFGDRLKKAREAKELTQPVLGKMLGVSKQSISHWEREHHEPNIAQLAQLCEILGTTADHLVRGAVVEWPFRRVKLRRVTELGKEELAYVEGELAAAVRNCGAGRPHPPPTTTTDRQELERNTGSAMVAAATKGKKQQQGKRQ